MMKRALLILCLAAPAAAGAEMLDINLSDEALRGEFSAPLPSLRAQYMVGGMTGEENDHRMNQVHAGLLVTGDAGAREANVTAGVGGRIVGLDADAPGGGDLTGGALGLGGMIDARVPSINRLGGAAYVYWAPKAAAFGDIDGHLEYGLSAGYELIRQALVYVGYRQVQLDIEQGPDVTADSGFHLGVRLSF